jgi:hypothetical protein
MRTPASGGDWSGPAMQALRASGYSNASRSKLVQGDVESLEWSDNRKFRCLGLGIIWRIPDAALSAMTARCRDLLLLETCVPAGEPPARQICT